MVHWHRQGAAVVGEVLLQDGRPGRAALVDGRGNPRGAVVVHAQVDGSVRTDPLEACLQLIPPVHVIDILCMQERVFGASELPVPGDL